MAPVLLESLLVCSSQVKDQESAGRSKPIRPIQRTGHVKALLLPEQNELRGAFKRWKNKFEEMSGGKV